MAQQPLPDTQLIRPAKGLAGSIRMPGDKSISHRYALLGAIAEGTTEIHNFASSADCQSTLDCLAKLGVPIERRPDRVTIQGVGPRGLRASPTALDAGNSGSTMRLLSGILAGQPFRSILTGDASLSRRPMKRIIDPLTQMGARISSADGGLPPLDIQGGQLKPICYEMPIASAQVKSAILLAGLFAEGVTEIREPLATRDHTEIALEQMGVDVERRRRTVTVRGPAQPAAKALYTPGDISSAAFFIVAGLLVPDSNLVIQNVGLNPTRTAILDVLASMGGQINVLNVQTISGELVGDLHVQSSRLQGGDLPVELIPRLIDELPVLAVLGTQAERGLAFRGAAELRVKESDRIKTVAQNLRRMGAQVEELEDGLIVPGRQPLRGAELDSYGDHRIAMAFAVAGLVADGSSILHGSRCVNISFPEFFATLNQVAE